MSEFDAQNPVKEIKKNIKLTLIIVIILISLIGGTYAYFAISISNNVITGNAAEVNLDLTVTKVLPTTEGVDDIVVVNFNELPDSLNNNCIYGEGEFALCQLYKINLANNSTNVNTDVKGSLSFDSPNATNLSWLYLGNNYNSNTTYTSAMLGNNFNTASSTFTNFIDSYLLTSGTNIDFYILVWVNETEDVQEDSGTYTGTVRFEDSNGKGVKSQFTS